MIQILLHGIFRLYTGFPPGQTDRKSNPDRFGCRPTPIQFYETFQNVNTCCFPIVLFWRSTPEVSNVVHWELSHLCKFEDIIQISSFPSCVHIPSLNLFLSFVGVLPKAGEIWMFTGNVANVGVFNNSALAEIGGRSGRFLISGCPNTGPIGSCRKSRKNKNDQNVLHAFANLQWFVW